MKLWNFCHNVLHMHVFYVFVIVLLIIMTLALYIQRQNQKKRSNEVKEIIEDAAKQVKAAGEAAGPAGETEKED